MTTALATRALRLETARRGAWQPNGVLALPASVAASSTLADRLAAAHRERTGWRGPLVLVPDKRPGRRALTGEAHTMTTSGKPPPRPTLEAAAKKHGVTVAPAMTDRATAEAVATGPAGIPNAAVGGPTALRRRRVRALPARHRHEAKPQPQRDVGQAATTFG